MSCRSVPATSAATSFAYLNSDLNEVQTLSAFHALRAEAPRSIANPTVQEYREYLDAERLLVRYHPNLTEARRASLLRRIDRALEQPPVDGRTFYAMRTIRSFTQAQSRDLQARYAQLAERIGVPVGRVRARAAELAAQVPPTRGSAAPAGYSPVTVAQFRADRLPVDRGTVHALTVLDAEAGMADLMRQPRTDDNRRITLVERDSAAISRLGYDPDGGRLEVVFRSNQERVYAYRNVPEKVFTEMMTGSAGRAWHEHIRGRDEYRYPTDEAAQADAFRRQCARCGQFAASTHACPTVAAPAVTPSPASAGPVTVVTSADVRALHSAPTAPAVPTEIPPPPPTGDAVQILARSIDLLDRRAVRDPISGVTTSAPDLRELRAELQSGPVTMRYRIWGEDNEDHDGEAVYGLSGTVGYSFDDEGLVAVDVSALRCRCQTYYQSNECPHVAAHETGLLRRVNPAAAQERDLAAAQAQAEEALHSDWMASKMYASQAAERTTDSPVRYLDDPDAFDADVAAAQSAVQAGRDPLGYVTDNATNGLLSRESGRGFGVEIEFNFPDTMPVAAKRDAIDAIGRDLYALNLTRTAAQREYHAISEDGYTDQHAGGWSFEEDGSVAGEIVSPIMYDEPETWRNLAAVCDIVKRHGGVADISTGSHVHVGSGDYGSDPAPLTELIRLANAHEDVLYRMSSNPASTAGHRPLGYCQPTATAPIAGYTEVHQAHLAHTGHDVGINMQSVSGAASDHIEFRQWDGTLDPSVIQAQVKMSAALTVAAKRITDTHGSVPRPREPIGAHLTRQRTLAQSGASMGARERHADTASARALIDTIFTNPRDKAQMAALFAITSWQPRRPGRAPLGHAA